MLVFGEDRPLKAAEVAMRFAEECAYLEGWTGKFLVSNRPIPVVTSIDLSLETLVPDRLEPSFRRYAIVRNGTIGGMVDVVESPAGEFEAVSMQPYRDGSKSLEALRVADASAAREGPRQIKMIEIPPISSSFIWVTGSDPEFIDRFDCKSYSEADFIAEMRRRLLERFGSRNEPQVEPNNEPDDEPEDDPDPAPGI